MFKLFSNKKETVTAVAEPKTGNSNYPAIVEEIHKEFNVAGDNLLKQAQDIVNNSGCNIDKAERLLSMGFHKTEEVEKWNKVKVTKDLSDLIMKYRENYPLNKFITDEQVEMINKKYNLVCAPVGNYTGFVPDSKLSLIENFKFIPTDRREDMVKVKSWSYDSQKEHQETIKSQYPDLIIPSRACSLGSNPCVIVNNEYIFIRSYEIAKFDTLFICAPAKDMKLTGLQKVGAVLNSFTAVHVPDPVVLQPVKGGYIIVAAWGDEASDEIVVNQTMN